MCPRCKDDRERQKRSKRQVVQRDSQVPMRTVSRNSGQTPSGGTSGSLGSTRLPKKGVVATAGPHLISRYDQNPGDELTRSRSKNGTKHLAVHNDPVRRPPRPDQPECGLPNMGDSMPETLRRLPESVGETGVETDLLLLDRQFFFLGGEGEEDIPSSCKRTGCST